MSRIFLIANLSLIIIALIVSNGYFGNEAPTYSLQGIPQEEELPTNVRDYSTGRFHRVSIDDSLWKRSLFRPDRTEIAEDGETEDVPAATTNVNMELTGIIKIGEGAVAVIEVQGGRPSPRRGRRAQSEGETETQRKVYSVGETIDSTSYTLIEITFDSIRVKSGTKELTIPLERGDESSSERKSRAASNTQQVNVNVSQNPMNRATPPAASSPPPPPPPPAATPPSNQSSNTENSLSRTERIKRALEARRRIIRSRKKNP